MNRGKIESASTKVRLKILTSELTDRDTLPEGVGFQESSFFHFHTNPWRYIIHVARYFHIAENLMENLLLNFVPTVAGTKLRILDIGCGYGEMREFLKTYMRPAGYSMQYSGIDADKAKLEMALQLHPQMDVKFGILPQALEAVGMFEGFVCSETLEHLTKEQGITLLCLMYAKAVKGAIAVFTVPTPAYSKVKKYEIHLHEYPVSEMLDSIEETGWKLVTWYWLRAGKETLPNNRLVPNSLLVAGNTPTQRDELLESGKDAIYIFTKE